MMKIETKGATKRLILEMFHNEDSEQYIVKWWNKLYREITNDIGEWDKLDTISYMALEDLYEYKRGRKNDD